MSTDMTACVFEETSFGKAALAKMREVPENFRIYCAGVDSFDSGIFKVAGAEFRVAKAGPNKGKLSIMVPGTKRIVYVTREECSND